jgi:predicted nucleotide-binding protein
MPPVPVSRPRVRLFIGSSGEALPLANVLEALLRKNARFNFNITVWDRAFLPSSITITELLEATHQHDFAIFLFMGDDTINIRNKQYKITRDNVIYEAGLFTGKLGLQRTFIIFQKTKTRRLTDLDGVTLIPLDLDGKISDKTIQELENYLAPIIVSIQKAIESQPLPTVDYQETCFQNLQRVLKAHPNSFSLDDLHTFSQLGAIRAEHYIILRALTKGTTP